jgi:hypothetical protein
MVCLGECSTVAIIWFVLMNIVYMSTPLGQKQLNVHGQILYVQLSHELNKYAQNYRM